MYKQNNKLLHSFFGIGTVLSVENRTILGRSSRVAICKFSSTERERELELMVNVDRDYHLMRPLISKEEVADVFDHLNNYQPDRRRPRWQARKDGYSTKLKCGDIYRRCEVVKDLLAFSQKRELSPWERAMLNNSRQVLVAELSEVSQLTRGQVREKVDRCILCRS
jgi:RNA polymerase-interacting CarD/CdnL/TRCF family regulator